MRFHHNPDPSPEFALAARSLAALLAGRSEQEPEGEHLSLRDRYADTVLTYREIRGRNWYFGKTEPR
jgi:hypothetical protein